MATDRPHGTRRRYIHGPDENGQLGKGCRCRPCTADNTRAHKAYRLATLRGRSRLMVPAGPAREHGLKLRAAGMTIAAMERLSGVSCEQIRVLLDGHPGQARKPARRILAGDY